MFKFILVYFSQKFMNNLKNLDMSLYDTSQRERGGGNGGVLGASFCEDIGSGYTIRTPSI